MTPGYFVGGSSMLNNIENGAKVDPIANMPGYWTFQIAGWLFFAALSYFSLTIWYNPGEFIPALHTIAQSIVGIAVSHPLRWVARKTWTTRTAVRILINGSAIIIASLIWTALRLGLFTWMTGEVIGFEDWGGWIFGSMTVFASWAFCYHALKYYRQWLEQRELSIKAQNAMLEAEALAERENVKRLYAENLVRESKLRMLNYQLNPHFFFNSLNSVTALVKRDDKTAAMEMLSRIGDFLRVSLEGSEIFEHPLRDEIEFLKLYLEIEKVRFGDRLNAKFNVSNEANGVEIPNLLLQPLIENSIKHAVGRSLSPTTIRVDAEVANGRLNIRLSDTGIGEPRESSTTPNQSPSIGLKNVEERLRSVYGDDYNFSTGTKKDGGFQIEISVPCKSPGKTGTFAARAKPAEFAQEK